MDHNSSPARMSILTACVPSTIANTNTTPSALRLNVTPNGPSSKETLTNFGILRALDNLRCRSGMVIDTVEIKQGKRHKRIR